MWGYNVVGVFVIDATFVTDPGKSITKYEMFKTTLLSIF